MGNSQYQEILLQQITAQIPDAWRRYGIKTIVSDGETELKFCIRTEGVKVNLIINYNIGTDLYDIEGWTLDGVTFWKSYELEGAYSEMLPDAFKSALKAGRDKSQKKLANALIEHSVEAKTHDLKKWM